MVVSCYFSYLVYNCYVTQQISYITFLSTISDAVTAHDKPITTKLNAEADNTTALDGDTKATHLSLGELPGAGGQAGSAVELVEYASKTSQRDEVMPEENRTSSTNVGRNCFRSIEAPTTPGQPSPTIQCCGGEEPAARLKEAASATECAEGETMEEEPPTGDTHQAEANAEAERRAEAVGQTTKAAKALRRFHIEGLSSHTMFQKIYVDFNLHIKGSRVGGVAVVSDDQARNGRAILTGPDEPIKSTESGWMMYIKAYEDRKVKHFISPEGLMFNSKKKANCYVQMKIKAGGVVSAAIDGFLGFYINGEQPQPKRMRLSSPPPIQPQADVAVQPQPTSASLIPVGGLLPADGLPASISQSTSESDDGLDDSFEFDPINFLGGDSNTTNAGGSGGLDPKVVDAIWDDCVARVMAEAASAAEHAEQKMEEEDEEESSNDPPEE
jgi:hypothetical protein